MAIIRQYKCDGCGAEKREANHWWAMVVAGGELRLTTLERFESAFMARQDPWKYAAIILCGQSCVSKTVSAFMGAQVRASDSQADGVKG